MRHESTGVSPFFLMFGREPRLPLYIAYGLEGNQEETHSLTDYVSKMRERLTQAYHIASTAIKKAGVHQKKNYDARVRGAVLNVGDRVLVKVLAFDGKHKLFDRWEEEPYVIV